MKKVTPDSDISFVFTRFTHNLTNLPTYAGTAKTIPRAIMNIKLKSKLLKSGKFSYYLSFYEPETRT